MSPQPDATISNSRLNILYNINKICYYIVHILIRHASIELAESIHFQMWHMH